MALHDVVELVLLPESLKRLRRARDNEIAFDLGVCLKDIAMIFEF